MTLKDKVAIVTGGNSGIGKPVVLGLAEAEVRDGDNRLRRRRHHAVEPRPLAAGRVR